MAASESYKYGIAGEKDMTERWTEALWQTKLKRLFKNVYQPPVKEAICAGRKSIILEKG